MRKDSDHRLGINAMTSSVPAALAQAWTLGHTVSPPPPIAPPQPRHPSSPPDLTWGSLFSSFIRGLFKQLFLAAISFPALTGAALWTAITWGGGSPARQRGWSMSHLRAFPLIQEREKTRLLCPQPWDPYRWSSRVLSWSVAPEGNESAQKVCGVHQGIEGTGPCKNGNGPFLSLTVVTHPHQAWGRVESGTLRPFSRQGN